MSELSKIINIGKVLEQQLNEVGIPTQEDLIKIGSREAWVRIKKIDSSACINRLYALEGAIQGIRWHNLDEITKKDLKEFFDAYK
ncbi:TfoX/Sxy family protein [Anaerorhabdus sp.]|jgi:DNA transformation protein and related proteins|uniref:TfoX/Sxy family protein n=1 Tax=Anaerorhabdus sp. TaxID=1872524 RepID=UPI002FCC9CBC